MANKAPVVKKVEKAKAKGGATKKAIFDVKTAVDTDGNAVKLTDDGRLTAVPANWTNDSRPLTRADFNSRSTFLKFRAEAVMGSQIAACKTRLAMLEERKADMILKADEAVSGGDPVARKKRRAEKLRKQLAELEEQLKADGIEL